MRIEHVESGRILAENAREARNHWQRFRGLMLRRALAPGEGLLIEPCSSIHMMFMLFAIDALFYDRDGRVTKAAKGVRPWIGMAWGGKGAHGVIELPRGSTEGVSPGDHIRTTVI